ncbi:sulfite exporter TauE/SafE family protein [Desulfovibrio ferrophilus]|uniref:Urease accessory protein UreH-like transmembrane domain-containing protein n=1 Tax=Desulfovibrio ferrophilus TaxID=241368 RepID=A0A2Z6AZI6_9BACT|nr:sulfite exporter TauE/SafE family protein [Desulfovibrio ferrophilus]BBD08566.1 uncharacterized protein DFE_1840 [Desulfovibrio ferrophilus]
MDLSIFSVALQSSFVIGLIHGINPCGHSWLVLAPFVSGERRASRVAWLTFMFLSGTALACVALGLSLGAISGWIPAGYQNHVDWVVNGIIIALGLALMIRPELLHSHDHEHGHHDHGNHEAHDHEQHSACCNHEHTEHNNHAHCGCDHKKGLLSRLRKATGPAMFGFGFVNMIIPCPTAAIMFKYSIESGDPTTSAMVFGSYAIGTALSVGLVIAGLYKAASWMRGLEKPWLESAIMRGAGALIVIVGVYSLPTGA